MRDLLSTGNLDAQSDVSESATNNGDEWKGFYSDLPEEKIRVDRKKLEQMLQGCHGEILETAEGFFQRVMDQTKTRIIWPSKLKIGAKSKKDPHIKVYGSLEGIREAKNMIKLAFDTKANKVTLKMDVAYTDHSHVIGRFGNNIQKVMKDTGCHIHFPDSNRSSETEKSNQVSIAGFVEGVEQARARIRGMLPLTFVIELSPTGPFQLPTPQPFFIRELEEKYDIKIKFVSNAKFGATTVVVQGSEMWVQKVKFGTSLLIEHLIGTIGSNIFVLMTIEVAPQHHDRVKKLVEFQHIANFTSTKIEFPNEGYVDYLSAESTVTISGTSVESVYTAKHLLMGCLPLVLLFDLAEDQEITQDVSRLMRRFGVGIRVKPKQRNTITGVTVKGIERESSRLYEVRRLLLNLEDEQLSGKEVLPFVPSQCVSNNGHLLSGFKNTATMQGQVALNVNTTNSIFPAQLLNPTILPPPPPVPNSIHVGGWSHGSYSGFPSFLLHHMFNQNACQHPTENVNRFRMLHGFVSDGSSLSAPSSTTSSLSSPSHSPPRASPTESLRNENVVSNLDANPSKDNNLVELFQMKKEGLSSGRSVLDLLTRNHGPSKKSDSSAVMSHNPSTGSTSNGSSVEDFFSSTKQVSFPLDYEKKKVLATKAMRQKPDAPQLRIPTSSWSGYGFSNSMPESIIRKLRGGDGLTFEMNGNVTADSDIDKDPWKSCVKGRIGGLSATGLNDGGYRKQCPEINLGSSNYIESASLPPSSSILLGTCTDLADLFRTLGLTKYLELFHKQEIDLETFKTLTDQDLNDLGITAFGARRKMLLAISNLNPQPSAFSVAPGAERKLSAARTSSSDSDNSPSTYW